MSSISINPILQEIAPIINLLKESNPLVHNITNQVVTNFTANGLLALGASPVMSNAVEEVADIAAISGAVSLNLGTLTSQQVEAMIIAGKAANAAGVPVILDPVATGVTSFRTTAATTILSEVHVDLVRGNAAEIASIAGVQWGSKGVDAGQASQDHHVAEVARRAALKWNTIVVVTGEEDYVTDGTKCFRVSGGHPILTKVTGTGCLLSSVIGAYCAVLKQDYLLAAAAALVGYSVAAELAAATTVSLGPGSFAVQFLNELSKLSPDSILAHGKVEIVELGFGTADHTTGGHA